MSWVKKCCISDCLGWATPSRDYYLIEEENGYHKSPICPTLCKVAAMAGAWFVFVSLISFIFAAPATFSYSMLTLGITLAIAGLVAWAILTYKTRSHSRSNLK